MKRVLSRPAAEIKLHGNTGGGFIKVSALLGTASSGLDDDDLSSLDSYAGYDNYRLHLLLHPIPAFSVRFVLTIHTGFFL